MKCALKIASILIAHIACPLHNRYPTGFIPRQDKGYLMLNVQLR